MGPESQHKADELLQQVTDELRQEAEELFYVDHKDPALYDTLLRQVFEVDGAELRAKKAVLETYGLDEGLELLQLAEMDISYLEDDILADGELALSEVQKTRFRSVQQRLAAQRTLFEACKSPSKTGSEEFCEAINEAGGAVWRNVDPTDGRTLLQKLCANWPTAKDSSADLALLRMASSAAGAAGWHKQTSSDGIEKTALELLADEEGPSPEAFYVGAEAACNAGYLNHNLGDEDIAMPVRDRVQLVCSACIAGANRVPLLRLVAAQAPAAMMDGENGEKSVLAQLFERFQPSSPEVLPLTWLTHVDLWRQQPAAGRNYNPLAVAASLKQAAWVEAIVHILVGKKEDNPTALTNDLLCRTPGLLTNVAQLFELGLGKHAVRLLSEGGVRTVLQVQSRDLEEIDPAAPTPYGCTTDRSMCDGHDCVSNHFDFEHCESVNCRRFAPGWAKLVNKKSSLRSANVLVFPQKPPVVVQAEPVMLSVDSAARAGSASLLSVLLQNTQGDQHSEVFSTDIVTEIIKFKWASYGQALFLRETAIHLMLVLSWTYLTVCDAQTSTALLAELGVFDAGVAVGLCALAGAAAEALLDRMHAVLVWLLALTAVVASAATLSSGGNDWSIVLAQVILFTLASRSLKNEALQLSDAVPTVAAFNAEYPELEPDPMDRKIAQLKDMGFGPHAVVEGALRRHGTVERAATVLADQADDAEISGAQPGPAGEMHKRRKDAYTALKDTGDDSKVTLAKEFDRISTKSIDKTAGVDTKNISSVVNHVADGTPFCLESAVRSGRALDVRYSDSLGKGSLARPHGSRVQLFSSRYNDGPQTWMWSDGCLVNAPTRRVLTLNEQWDGSSPVGDGEPSSSAAVLLCDRKEQGNASQQWELRGGALVNPPSERSLTWDRTAPHIMNVTHIQLSGGAHFSHEDTLKFVCRTYVTDPVGRERHVKALFDRFDKDRDGMFNIEEYKAFLQGIKLWGGQKNDSWLQAQWPGILDRRRQAGYDTRDGKLYPYEAFRVRLYSAACGNRSQLLGRDIKMAFGTIIDDAVLDEDEKGRYRKRELVVRRIFEKFDADGDGRLNKDEYKHFLLVIGLWGRHGAESLGRVFADETYDVSWEDECKDMCAEGAHGCDPALGITLTAFHDTIYCEGLRWPRADGTYKRIDRKTLDRDLDNVFGTTLEEELQMQDDARKQREREHADTLLTDLSLRRRQQRYTIGLAEYISDGWNVIDLVSLVAICVTTVRLVLHAETGGTTQVAAVGTSLLWVRVIQYLNGLDATAAYVRMTLSVMRDMKSFVLILVILVVGNSFVLMQLYPRRLLRGAGDGSAGWHLDSADEKKIEGLFGDVGAALFTSTNMLFFGSDPELLNNALSPRLATWHYIFYVSLTPLIMMNLLIALMGGSYERVEQNTKNAMLRQRAELLVSLEALMTTADRDNVEYFPRWLFWYRPVEREDRDDSAENGVINGVGRMLRDQSAVQRSEVQELVKKMEDVETKLEARLSAGQRGDIQRLEQKIEGMDAKLEALLARLPQAPAS